MANTKRLFCHLLFMLVAFLPTSQAAILLNVDLTVPNTVTIRATTGASSATVSGDDDIGVYFEDFFSGPGNFFGWSTFTPGTLTTSLNPSAGITGIDRPGFGADLGLGVYGFSSDLDVDFQIGVQAFTGETTWALATFQYSEILAGPSSGNLYFPAQVVGDVPGATLIGTWTKVAAIPEPSLIGLLGTAGLGLFLLTRRRIKLSKVAQG